MLMDDRRPCMPSHEHTLQYLQYMRGEGVVSIIKKGWLKCRGGRGEREKERRHLYIHVLARQYIGGVRVVSGCTDKGRWGIGWGRSNY